MTACSISAARVYVRLIYIDSFYLTGGHMFCSLWMFYITVYLVKCNCLSHQFHEREITGQDHHEGRSLIFMCKENSDTWFVPNSKITSGSTLPPLAKYRVSQQTQIMLTCLMFSYVGVTHVSVTQFQKSVGAFPQNLWQYAVVRTAPIPENYRVLSLRGVYQHLTWTEPIGIGCSANFSDCGFQTAM